MATLAFPFMRTEENPMFQVLAMTFALFVGGHTPTSAPGPELFGRGLFSTGHDDAHVTFSADGTTAWFLRNSPDFTHWTVLASHRHNGHWQAPEVASFSGRYKDADVSVDNDGKRMFFISNRPTHGDTTRSDTDIWTM